MTRESLYANPSFLSGVARIFDFWGLFDSYNTSADDETADSIAIGSDWRAVGEDLRAATQEFEDSHRGAQQLDLFAMAADEGRNG